MFFEGRGPTEVTILNPRLTYAELQTLVANYNTLRALNSTVIVTCGDQLQDGTTVMYTELLEETIKACSNAPAFKTKVGAEVSATINISSTKKDIFQLATNARQYDNAGVLAYALGDDAGLITDSPTRQFKTVIFRAYESGLPTTDSSSWIIFPRADVEGNAEMSFNNTADRGYQITITGYELRNDLDEETNTKMIIGDPALALP